MKTELEVNYLIGEIMARSEDPSKKKFFGMTYEQGLREALEWVIDNADHPFEGED